MTLNEKLYAVLEWYAEDIVPLEMWETDDLIELGEVVRAELQERDRIIQNDYFDEHEGVEDETPWQCCDPLCPCNNGGGSYGGTE